METTVNQRIETIRKHLGISQRAFAQLLDIDEATYSKYKKEVLIPGQTLLDKIVKKVENISIEWLFYGKNDIGNELKVEESLTPNYTNTMNPKIAAELLLTLSDDCRLLKRKVAELEDRLNAIESPSKKKNYAG